ncbi:uncharacterized protein LOC125649258 [Ostrea edulis]|uniref:uncharacterized protein LOC125649258 n=1 Tax=Ostrea edulis TaxID=37623 RepID=UPI0024AF27F2|nr:uncharacterized protein LOC125649258 [Ostrea edulis]
MQCIFTLLTLFLLIVRITSDCVDILSGCRKACLSNGECSVSTGYLCQEQVCQGKCHLKADVSGRNATLTWRDFKPPDYQFEYSVTFSTSRASEFITWTKLEVGSLPVCYLYDLKPGTIYYAAVGIWKDKNFLEYEETSEIISFKTLDAEFCTLGMKKLHVGDILTNGCEDRCVCQSTGELNCEPLCDQYRNQSVNSTHHGCHQETTEDGCCTYIKCSSMPIAGSNQTPIIPNTADLVSIQILQKSSDWVRLNASYRSQPAVSLVLLCIKQANKENSTLEIDTEGYSQRLYLIDRLQPGVEYALWMWLVLVKNHTVSSPKVYFNTTARKSVCTNCTQHTSMNVNTFQSSSSHSGLYVGLTVGILSVIGIAFSMQIFLLLRKRKLRSKKKTLFFVKGTFGVERLMKDEELHM